MMLVMKELALEIPQWKLNRVIDVGHAHKPDGTWSLTIKAMDIDDTPSSYIKTLSFHLPEEVYQKNKFFADATNAEHTFEIGERIEWRNGDGKEKPKGDLEILLRLSFYEYYMEPSLHFVYKITEEDNGVKYLLEYEPASRKFTILNLADRADLTNTVGRGWSIKGAADDDGEKEDEERDKEESAG